jgi:hypothetical protein
VLDGPRQRSVRVPAVPPGDAVRSNRTRWLCPVCSKPNGAVFGLRLAAHGNGCPGAGADVSGLEPVFPETWIPTVQLPDRAPFRRWRSYGWTQEQIAAVTGPGALW